MVRVSFISFSPFALHPSPFAEADTGQAIIHIPAVVVAEVIMVVQKGRLQTAAIDHIIPYLRAMAESDNYMLSPLHPETVIASHKHTSIPDIFDRLIATEAVLRGLYVVTRDQVIRESGLVTTIWD